VLFVVSWRSKLLRLLHGPPGGFSTIAPAKMNGSEPNLAGRNNVTKGNHRKIWALIACVAPPGAAAPFFVCSYVASPFDPLRTERPPISASNHVILLLIYAHRQKFRFFTRRRREDRKKAILEIFGEGVLSVGYSLHRASDLHAKSMYYY